MRAIVRAVGALVGFYLAVLALAFPLLLGTALILGGGVFTTGVSFAAVSLAALVVYVLLWKLGWGSKRMFGWPGVGWQGVRLAFRAFAFGTAIGCFMAAAALTLALTAGSARVSLTGESVTQFAVTAGSLALLLLVAALSEELLFRGYPLSRLSAVLGKAGASVVLAIAFALAHLFNPSVSALGLVNIGLASLVLSAAFFTSGGLSAAWGLHWGWNAGLALLADAPVSGLEFDLPALDFTAGEPMWLTGGRFGPEGGLVATAAMAVVLVWLTRKNAQTTEDYSL
ncbi:MAG: CPBP family intramembrane metalloprotease [Gemmatimonadota bacterium]|nr:MAG: CPBP family intramembrane metalloprotease [Gemmatimonadota bacterium]